MQANISLILGQKNLQVDHKFIQVSQFVKVQKEDFNQNEIVLSDLIISEKILNDILKFATIHNYNPPFIKTPIQSSDLKSVVGDINYEFIKGYDIRKPELKQLADAAKYLQISTLYQLCIAKVAVEMYFGQTQKEFDELLCKHGVDHDIKVEEEQEYLKNYPWIKEF